MRIPRRWGMSLTFPFLLAACGGGQWVVPVVPPGPGHSPVPPKPVPPAPIPPSAVASAENVAKVVVGMTRAQVDAQLGVAAVFSSRQDDGTTLADYPALDEAGKPVYLSAHFDAAGVLIGRARIPRAVPPEPVAFVDDECPGGRCHLRR